MINRVSFIFRDRHDVWSFLNVVGRFVFRLITVALLIKVLNQEEMALWYVFLALFGVSAILEAGLKLVVTKQIACKVSYVRPAFSYVVKRVYLFVVLLVCAAALFVGPAWINHGTNLNITRQTEQLWVLFVLASGIGMWSGVQAGMISGVGEVAIAQKNELIGQTVNAVVFVILWFYNVVGGLALPILAMLSSSLIVLYFNFTALRKLLRQQVPQVPKNYIILVMKSMFNDGSKMLVSVLSFHLLTSAFLLIIAANQPVEVVAAYGLSMQVLSLVLGISGIWVTASFPRMAAAKGDKLMLRQEFLSAVKRTLPILMLGMLVAVWLAPIVVAMIKGENMLLPNYLLWLLAIMLMLENVFSIGANLLQSQGAFGRVAKYSFSFAILVVFGALVSFEWLGFGLFGLLLLRLGIGIVVYDSPISYQSYKMLRG